MPWGVWGRGEWAQAEASESPAGVQVAQCGQESLHAGAQTRSGEVTHSEGSAGKLGSCEPVIFGVRPSTHPSVLHIFPELAMEREGKGMVGLEGTVCVLRAGACKAASGPEAEEGQPCWTVPG